MPRYPNTPPSHLLALEPRMMFDGAAVVTAAATLSVADGQDGGPFMPNSLATGMNNVFGENAPEVGLAPSAVRADGANDFAADSVDGAVTIAAQDSPSAFSDDLAVDLDDRNNMAVVSLQEAGAADIEPSATNFDLNNSDSFTVKEQVSVKEAVVASPSVNAAISDPGPFDPTGTNLNEDVRTTDISAYRDALPTDELSTDIREVGVRPADFRDYFVIDDNDSRAVIGQGMSLYQQGASDDAVVEQNGAAAGQDYIFIDTNVENYQELAETWAGKGVIVLIDGNSDGIDQIMTALAGVDNIGAIHLVSHGDEGVFWLGTTQIDSASVSGALASSLASIGAKLTADGDILIYGCDVGDDEAGQQLMNALAATTGADIAASIDDTGSILRGGDWTLENRLGVVESASLVARDWDGLLAPTSISAPNDSLTVRDANGNIVASGSNGFTESGNRSPGQTVGATGTWDNVGTVSGQSISIRATIVSISSGDTIRFDRPTGSNDDPAFLLRSNGGPLATAEVRWDIFFTASGAPVDIDVSYTVADIDGASGQPRSREFVTVSTDTLSSFENAGTSNIVFDTSTVGEVTASGTQSENSNPPQSPSAARFNWLDTNNFTITYNIDPASGVGQAGFSHDGDLDFNLGSGGTTVSIPRLDLDRNDSTASGSGYQGTYVENRDAVGIVDRDVRITNPDGQVQSASITLTNAQAGDRLLVNGSDAASGTVRGISYTRTDTGVELTGADSARDYRLALRAITFENTTERPSEVDRNINISFANAALNSNVAVSTISVVEINDPPTAVNDATQATNESTAINNIDVLANDFDGDGDTLSVVSASAPNGTLVINGDGTLNYTPNSGFSGTDTVTYMISDGRGGTSTATFDVTVASVNDPPVPVGSLPPQSNVDAAQGIFVGTSQGFSDPDNGFGELSYSATGLPPGLSINANTGAITGTIDNSASQGGSGGVYNIVVTATDPDGEAATQSFAWTITNPPPQANNDGGATNEDTPVTVNVLANDRDPDGDAPLTVVAASAPNGTVVINADGTLTYTPNADFNGNDVITYTISDGEGGTDTAVYNMTVVAVNDGPVPVGSLPPQASVDADGGVSVATASGFSDIDGPTISYSAAGLPPGLSINSNTGEITGTIDNSASQGGTNGVYNVTITATDFQGTPATQVFVWTVTNPGPTAANDTASTDEDTAVTVNVLTNDNDPDGDDLSVTAASAVNGTVVVNPDGTITYTPNAGFNGTDTITYTISDGEGGTSTATVDVTIAAVNDAPTPVGSLPPQTNVDADTGISIATAGGFTDSDDATLTYGVSGLPAGLSIDANTGEITGTIDRSASQGGSNGVYTVTVTATDAGGLSTTQTFSWTVTNPGPVAVNDTATTNEDTAVLIDVLPNDSDPDGDPITLIAAAATVGQATVVGNQVNYAPPANFNGTATITYTISDGEGGTATATITVTVTPENDAPVGTALPPQDTEDGAVISVPVAANFTDVDGDRLTFAAADLPPGLSIDPDSGVISGTIDNSASQTGGGVYTATITVSDGNGGTTTQTITFNVTNPGPLAVDDSASTDEDVPVTISPLANDSDPDGDDLTITAADAVNGSVVVNPDGTVTYTPNPGFNGTDTITYEISDGEGGTSIAEITVTVADVNDIPTISGSIGDQTNLDSQVISLPVAGAFTDPDGDALSYTATGLPAGLTIDPATGVISGTIDRSASQVNGGVYAITVTADDGRGGTVSTTFEWTVTNPAPVASNDSVTTDEDTDVNIAVLTNDVDADGDPLTITEAEAGNGTVTINPDGTLAYSPNANFNGEDTIIYTISDGEGGFSTATVTVTVTPVNDGPTTVGLANQNGEDGADVSIPTAQGFDDIDGDDLTFTASGLPPTLFIDPDTGLITGTLDSDSSVNGPFVVTVTATDPSGESVSTTFVYSIQNIPPIAVNDVATTPEDTPVTVAVLTNDSDPDGDALTITAASTSDGTVVVNPDGTLTFTPAENFNGQAVVSYTVSDGQGGTATATLTVDVVAVNDAPESLPIPDVTNEDNQSVSVDTGSFFSDLDGDTLTFGVTGLPDGLSIDPATGIISGTIDRDASQLNGGIYSVTVTGTDPDGLTTSQTFTWTVTNPAPTAVNDTATTDEDTPVDINVLANDTDPDGDVLTVTMATALNGTVTIAPDGTLTYVPDANFNGADTITYVISDGNGGTSTAAVDVTVNAVNDPPVAVDDVATTNEDTPVTIGVLGNDSDIDGDPLTVTDATSPDGTVVINPDGTVTFTPNPNFNGPTTISYTISDGNGGTSTATVSITVDAVNDPPVANMDSATTDEDTPVDIAVLTNDTDVDGDPLNVTAADAPNGTVTINPDGTVTYVPDPDFNGTDTITYTISDGQGGFSTSTVEVTVNAVNDAPVATPIAPQNDNDADVISVSVASNFTDVDGDTLAFTAMGLPPGLSIDAVGNITGTIDPDASQGGPGSDGIYRVTVTADDGDGGTVSQTFVWEVNNPAPVATDDVAATDEDTPVIIPVLANDNDPDGDALSVTSATASNGLVTINPDGTITYTPNPDFNGTDTITYTISDGNGGTSTATVEVTVAPVNDAPVASSPLPNVTGVDGEMPSIPTAGNFSDVDGDTLTFTAAGLPAGLSIDPDTGLITGTIDNQASQINGGIYTVTVTADDGNGGTVDSTFTYSVTNPAPTAANDSATTDEDTPVIIDVLANDNDPDGDDLTATVASAPNGTVVINPDGTVTYTPNQDFNGTDTITYTISDGNGGTSTATVDVTVAPVNDAPEVDIPIADLSNEDADVISVDISDKFSDLDGDTLTFTAAGLPAGLSIDANGVITGTIDNQASQLNGGVYTITITADDGNGGTVDGSFTWIVTNPAPTAADDTATTDEDTPSAPIAVLANDNDPDGDTLTVTSATAPNGTIVINPDGTLVYTPAANFNGTDTITYSISDGNGGTSTATVEVTVVAVNDAPTADPPLNNQTNDDADVISVDVSGSFEDLDGDTLSFTASGLPDGLTIDTNGVITGTIDPDASQLNGGVYTVTVTADDSNGGTVDSVFTWTVNNPPPVADNDMETTAEDTAVNIAVLTNDNDPDGDALTVISADSANGVVVIEADGTITYQPDPNFNGTDTIVYTISDGNGGTATATVEVTVTAVNDAPETVGLPDLFDLNNEDIVVPLGLAFNDVDDATLVYTVTGLPGGLAFDVDTGEITGTIDANASTAVTDGEYTVTVTATDAAGLFVSTTFTWTIGGLPPTAINDNYVGTEDTLINLDVLANDTDPDGDPMTPIEIVSAVATNGTAVILPDGTINFTPDPDFNGTATVTYTIQDINGEFATAVATIVIDPVNDAPDGTILPNRDSEDGDVVSADFGPLFSDPEGGVLTFTAANLPDGLSIDMMTGEITGTIDPDASQANGGVYQVEITATDDGGEETTQSFIWTITNPGPTANADMASTTEDTPTAPIDVLTNDNDPDGDDLTVTTASADNGAVVINADGTLTYTPDANFNGTDTITYQISDGQGGSSTSTVTVTVDPENDDPTVTPLAALGNADADVIALDVSGSFDDLDGDTLTFTQMGLPPGLTIDTAGNITGTIDPSASQGGPNGDGIYSVTITADDSVGGTVSSTFSWTVTNPPPVAVNDGPIAVTEDTPLDINVLGNDNDPDGDMLTVTLATAGNGEVTINPDGTINYVPDPDYNGPDTITYTISDGNGGTSTATVVINVGEVNDEPVASPIAPRNDVDGAMVSVPLASNFSDVDGDALTFTAAGLPLGLTIDLNTGIISGTIDSDASQPAGGVYTVVVTADDGRGGTVDQSFTWTITNPPPIAVNDTASTSEDLPVNIPVLGNDSDPDGDMLTVTTASAANGSVVIQPNGTIDYTPNQDFNGTDTITYTISDGNGGTATATVTVTVGAVNDPPVAVDDATVTDEETPVTIPVLANDGDVDGDPLTVTTASAPNGTIVINPDGTITYTPDQDFNGTDTITYVISDGQGGTDTATVAVTVNPVNDAPVAVDDVATTPEDTPITLNVLSNDTDVDGDPLTVTGATSPDGQVTINPDGTVTFVPDPNFNGTTTVTYTISDGNGGTATATVTLTVDPVNDVPVATPDVGQTDEDAPVTVSVLENDTDADGDPLTVTAASAPNGTVVINPDGTVTYTPDPNFNGTDTITYTVSDGNGGFATTTATITVNPVNDVPVAVNDNVSTPEDAPVTIPVLGNDTDADGDPLTVTDATSPDGTVVINPDGTITFTPDPDFNGPTAITYTVSDGNGGTSTATVTVDVTPVNDAPVATPAVAATPEDTPVTLSPLDNATDVDGDPLVISSATSPNGTVTINPDGTITYTPDPNFNGTDVITYQVSDGNGGFTTATITVTVAPVNDPPVAANDIADTDEERPLVIPVLANDVDLDGDPLTVTNATAANGTIVINPDGTITYTPNVDFFGTDTITYTISDGNGGTSTATVAVTVRNVNEVPVDGNEEVFGIGGAETIIDVLANGSDPDGDPLSVFTAKVDIGTVVINPDGTISHFADPEFQGVATITYIVSDGQGGFVESTATVIVTQANANVNDLLGNPGIGYPDSERLNTTLDPITEFITTPLIIDDTVNSFKSLNNTPDLNGSRPLLTAVNGLRSLNGMGELDVDGSPIGEVVNQLDQIRDLRFGADRLFDPRFGDFLVEGLTGFSVRQLSTGSDQVMIESVVRDRVIYMEVRDIGAESDPRMVEYQLRTRDGSPLPSWIRMDARGLAIIERPVDAETVRLIVRAIRADGQVTEIPVIVQGATGEIQIDEKTTLSQNMNGAAPLGSAMAMADASVAEETAQLLAAFKA